MTSAILLTERAGRASVCKGSTYNSRVWWATCPEQNQCDQVHWKLLRSHKKRLFFIRATVITGSDWQGFSSLSRLNGFGAVGLHIQQTASNAGGCSGVCSEWDVLRYCQIEAVNWIFFFFPIEQANGNPSLNP